MELLLNGTPFNGFNVEKLARAFNDYLYSLRRHSELKKNLFIVTTAVFHCIDTRFDQRELEMVDHIGGEVDIPAYLLNSFCSDEFRIGGHRNHHLKGG